MNTKTAGEYECVADADGHNAVAAKAMVHITGPPVIVNGKGPAAQSAALFQYKGPASSTSTQLAQPGETGFVLCEAFSVPEAEIIEWSFKVRSYWIFSPNVPHKNRNCRGESSIRWKKTTFAEGEKGRAILL